MKDNLVNGLALACALALSTLGALQQPVTIGLPSPARLDLARPYAQAIKDGRGQLIRTGEYQRIVSLDPEVSRLLLSLISPSQLVGVSSYAVNRHPWGYRFGAMQLVDKSSQVERIAALEPDLVFVTPLADEASVSRLRELGIPVFDLGGNLGIDASVRHLGQLGELLHQRERAALAQANLRQRERGLKAYLGEKPRRPGIYLTRYGDKFYGGTIGSSYGDLLRLGGVDDLAAKHGYKKYPSYSLEELCKLDPPLIVTSSGQGRALCAHPEVAKLTACGPDGEVVEVLPGLDSDSGAGLLSAAGDLLQRLHPSLK